MTASSALRGHGIARRKKQTGKRKCRIQGEPPTAYMNKMVSSTALKAPRMPETRHSGLASKKGCTAARKMNAGKAIAASLQSF